MKLVQQLQIIFRLVLCIAHRCDCNKRNKDPVCTYCIRCKHTNDHRISGYVQNRPKIRGKCLLGLVDLGSTMGKRHRLNKPVLILGLATSGFWVSISIMINILVCITTSSSVDSHWVSMSLPITKFTCMWNCPNPWLHTVHIWQKKMSKATKGMLQFCLDSHIFSNYYQTFLFGVLKLGHTSCLVSCKKKLQGGALIFNKFSQVSFSAIFHEI